MPKQSETPRLRKPIKPKDILDVSNKLLVGRTYVWIALIVLGLTTLLWSILGARIQQSNSDQLIYPLLFQHLNILKSSPLPGQHTFLIKWPIFILLGLVGPTTGWIDIVTVLMSFLVVGSFVYILYRIDKRPWVFATLCLALASVLLMIPAEPYAGALLPVNLAMITTRNIEYIIFIVSVVLVAKYTKLKSWAPVGAIVLLTLLFASDKLFLTISLGAAGLLLVVYALVKAWDLVNLSVNLLVFSLISAALASLLLAAINATHLVNISGILTNSPYASVDSLHSFILGCIFAVLGILTNLGANPATNYTILRHVPSQVFHGLASPGGLAYIINFLIFLVALYSVCVLVFRSFKLSRRSTKKVLDANKVSLVLIASSLIAIASFVLSKHDYAVDGRYLAIVLFTLFICLASYARTKKLEYRKLAIVGLVILIGIVFGVFRALDTYHSEVSALNYTNSRDKLVSQLLNQKSVNNLIGNYWNVVPVKYADQSLSIQPLTGCTQAGNIGSSAWKLNLKKQSFAYILYLKKGLTNYPACDLAQIVGTYGKPRQSVLISGSLENPSEVLLFYPHGLTTSVEGSAHSNNPSTVIPVSVRELETRTSTVCNGPTLMTFVAHEDDDLLFTNPDLQTSINAGDCIRTVYLTAGDGGNGAYFWLGRESGSEAAYSYMTKSSNDWVQRIVELNAHEFVTVASPSDNPKISLIFMHLPDGNLKGQGFPSTGFESLAKLEAGQVKTINSVDGQSYYSLGDLTNALVSLMHTYLPADIHTQANYVSKTYPDHSDHIAVGNVVRTAASNYDLQQYGDQIKVPIQYYIGYPIHGMAVNVSGADLTQKEKTWFSYAKYDPTVCQNIQQCNDKSAYGFYLTRQYQYGS